MDGLLSMEGALIVVLAFIFGVFEKIIDIIIDVWEWLTPFHVIDEYEEAVVLRWGVFNRKLSPGFRWIWPFGIEQVLKDSVVRQTSYLDVQSLTTKDGKSINISPIIVYKIGNIRRWLLEVDDAEDALHDVTYGIVDELVTETLFDDIKKPAFSEKVTKRVYDEGISWGARVEVVKFSDRVNSRSIRLWTGSGMEYGDDD